MILRIVAELSEHFNMREMQVEVAKAHAAHQAWEDEKRLHRHDELKDGSNQNGANQLFVGL